MRICRAVVLRHICTVSCLLCMRLCQLLHHHLVYLQMMMQLPCSAFCSRSMLYRLTSCSIKILPNC
ncbi:hypothetical protein D3C80_2058430 [compost metagenome]